MGNDPRTSPTPLEQRAKESLADVRKAGTLQSREKDLSKERGSITDAVAAENAIDPADYLGVGELNLKDERGQNVTLRVPRMILKQIEAASAAAPGGENDLSADQRQALVVKLAVLLRDTYRENGWLPLKAEDLELIGLDPRKDKAQFEKREALRQKIIETWDKKLGQMVEAEAARIAEQAEQIKAQATGNDAGKPQATAAEKAAQSAKPASLKDTAAEVERLGSAIDSFETDLREVYDKTNAVLASAQRSGLLDEQKNQSKHQAEAASIKEPATSPDSARAGGENAAELKETVKTQTRIAVADLEFREPIPVTKPIDRAEFDARDREIAALRKEVDEALKLSYLERAVTNNVAGPEDPAFQVQQELAPLLQLRDSFGRARQAYASAKAAGYGSATLGFLANGLAALAGSLRSSTVEATAPTELAKTGTAGQKSEAASLAKLDPPPAIGAPSITEQRSTLAPRAALVDELASRPIPVVQQKELQAPDIVKAEVAAPAPAETPATEISATPVKKSLRDNLLKEIFGADTAFAARRVNLQSARTQDSFIKSRFAPEAQELMQHAAKFMRTGDLNDLAGCSSLSAEQKIKLAVAARPHGLETLEAVNDLLEASGKKREKLLAKATADVRLVYEELNEVAARPAAKAATLARK